MTEEKQPSSELEHSDEKKTDLDDKKDGESYSNGSYSQVSIYEPFRWNRFHRCMIVSIVLLACFAFVGITAGMIIGFVIQRNQMSNLEQRLIARDIALGERIDDIESQLVHCKHCNSTVHSDSSSYDDRELRMKVDNIDAVQNEIQSQVNSTQFMLFNHGRQIIALQQQAQENITHIESKLFGLGEIVANMSEQINHLFLMRNDHSDQLSQINSNISNISTQLMHVNGSVNNLASELQTQRVEVATLGDRMSTLNSLVDEIDQRDATKNSQLDQEISELNQSVSRLQSDNVRISNQVRMINGRVDNLDRSSAVTLHSALYSTVIIIIIAIIA